MGPAVHPVRRRRPLADADRRGGDRRRAVLFVVALPHRAAAPWSTCAAGGASMREADLPGALLLAVALSGVILAFATADPKIQVFSDQGVWYLLGGAVAAALFVRHQRRADRSAGAEGRPDRDARVGLARGQLLHRSRADRGPDRHPALRAHHRLPRLPAPGRAGAGPVPGGAARRRGHRWLPHPAPAGRRRHGRRDAAGGGRLPADEPVGAHQPGAARPPASRWSSAASASASPWRRSTRQCWPRPPTTCTGSARPSSWWRGWSACSSASRPSPRSGLRSYYAEQGDVPPAREVCDGRSRCTEFTLLLKEAGIAQEQTVFLGAAVCALVAGLLALLLFRRAATRGLAAGDLLRAAG